MNIKKVLFLIITLTFIFFIPSYAAVDRIERLKSRVKRGIDYYRDGRFTISKLSKKSLGSRSTLIQGLITNDTTRRAVSVQLEVTCYNAEGDLIDTKLLDINYLGSRETQPFRVKIKESAEEITLFEALIQDAIWDEY